jgi:hypothetical protein
VRQPLRMPKPQQSNCARATRHSRQDTAVACSKAVSATPPRAKRRAMPSSHVESERTTHTLRNALRHIKSCEMHSSAKEGGASDAHTRCVEHRRWRRDAPWRTPTRRAASPCTLRQTTRARSLGPAPAGRSGTRRHPSKKRTGEGALFWTFNFGLTVNRDRSSSAEHSRPSNHRAGESRLACVSGLRLAPTLESVNAALYVMSNAIRVCFPESCKVGECSEATAAGRGPRPTAACRGAAIGGWMARLHQSVFNNMNSSQIVKAHALRCGCRRATAARNATRTRVGALRPLDPLARTRFEPATAYETRHLQNSKRHDCCMSLAPTTWGPSQLHGRRCGRCAGCCRLASGCGRQHSPAPCPVHAWSID